MSEPKREKQPSPGVETFSFDKFLEIFESRDTGERPPGKPAQRSDAKKLPGVEDRQYLKDIEILLNNCVNLAERLEGKEGAKLLQLLSEARERAIRLRG